MPMPKTLKFVLKGEFPVKSEVFVMDDGSEVSIERKKKSVVPSKKNQKRVIVKKRKTSAGEEFYQGYLIPSAQYEKWHAATLPIFKKFADQAALKGVRLPIVRAKIKVLFYFSDAIDKDLSNKFEAIADLFKEAGIIADDSFKVLKPVYLDGWVHKDNPRTEMYLSILTPQDQPKEYEWDITSPEYHKAVNDRRNLKKRLKRKAVMIK